MEVTVDMVSDGVEIQISDDGPGINEQEARVLRSGTETPLMHGSGLGLWLCHWIVSSNHGSIDLTATDEGTTVTISLPASSTATAELQLPDLKRARDQYKAAFDEAGDGMTITDDNARILDVNNEAARLYGVDKQELLGRSIREFLPEHFDFEVEWGEIKTAESKRGELDIVSVDGGVTPVSYTAKSHIVPGQHLIVSRDITERKEREQTLTERTNAIEKAPIGITITDPSLEDNPLIYANDKFLDLTGYSREEIVGENCRFLQGENTDPDRIASIREAIEEEEPVSVEIKNYRKDGTEFWNHLEIAPVRDDAGEVVNWIGFQQDVTERKERERQIEQEQARFKAVFDDAFDPMVIANDDGEYIAVNESATELFGVTEEELLGRSISEFASEDFDFEAAWNEFQDSEDDRGTFPLVRADGSERVVEYAATRDIAPGEHLSILRDITEQKEREREMELAEIVFQNTQDALVLVDVVDEQEYRLNRVNDAFLEFTPYTDVNIIGMTPQELLGDEVGGDIQSQFQECVTSKNSIEFEQVVPADGGSRIWQVRLTPLTQDGEVRQLVLAMRNITERRERDRRYDAIFNQTFQFTGLLEPDGTIIEANETALEFANVDREDVLGNPIWEAQWFEGDDTKQKLENAVNRARDGEFVRHELEAQGAERNGIFDFSIRPITDEQGQATLLVPEGRDISERKERQQEIAGLKERYETLLDAAPDPVFVADGETGEIIEANEAAGKLLGESGDDIVGRHQSALHPSDKSDLYRELFEGHVQSEDLRRNLPDGSPIHVVTADGEEVPVEISVDTVSLPEGIVTFGIFRDISERIEREK